MARSGCGSAAIFASTALAPSALAARRLRRVSAFSSWMRELPHSNPDPHCRNIANRFVEIPCHDNQIERRVSTKASGAYIHGHTR
jgi:hypothetical protein